MWSAQLPVRDARRLLDAALKRAERPARLLPFLWAYSQRHPGASTDIRDAALRVLLDLPNAKPNTMEVYEWSVVAKLYLDDDAIELARAALAAIGKREQAAESELMGVLKDAWQRGDRELLFLEVIAPQVLAGTPEAWWARRALKNFPLSELGSDFLVDWVRADAAQRVHILAEVVGAPGEVVSELHARLLSDFAREEVGSTLKSDFLTGNFMGEYSDWLSAKLEMARAWLSDPRPGVRDWAATVVHEIESEMPRAKSREDEDRLLE